MSGDDLSGFEAAFARALLSGDPAARPAGLDADTAHRFRVYRNNYYHGLGHTLGEAYPVVRQLVGEPFFLAVAHAFLWAYPPRTRSLALFGGAFPGFLDAFPPARSLPYLGDVARLERARLEALHAADQLPLGIGGWSQPPAEDLARMTFAPHSALRIVESAYPVVALWRMHQPDAAPGPRRLEASPETALVTRPGPRVEIRTLSPAETAFARALAAGHEITRGDEAAREIEGQFDAGAAFAGLLAAGALVLAAR